MKEYTTLAGENRTELEILVNKRLQEGWKLQGGIAVCNFPSNNTERETGNPLFYQAMVRKSA